MFERKVSEKKKKLFQSNQPLKNENPQTIQVDYGKRLD